MCFSAFFRAKYFFFQNSRVLRALIWDFENFLSKNFGKLEPTPIPSRREGDPDAAER